MDYNNYLSNTWMPVGVYDFYDQKVHFNNRQKSINKLCAMISFFCGFKTILILIIPDSRAVFYLIELYVIDGYAQKAFHFGITFLHFQVGFAYLYWAHLMRDVNRMKPLNHLFISSLDVLCKYYNLEHRATKRFIEKANMIRLLMKFVMFGFEMFFVLFILRCLGLAYHEIKFVHFLFISIPLAIVTFISFHCLTIAILSVYVLLFTTQEFLKLRAMLVSEQLIRYAASQSFYTPNYRSLKYQKVNHTSVQIMQTINHIVRQFNESNRIFDNIISLIFVNVLLCGLIYPSFMFFQYSFFFKILTVLMYIGGEFIGESTLDLYMNEKLIKSLLQICPSTLFGPLSNHLTLVGFSVTVYNDYFVNKMKVMQLTIHHVMPLFEGVDMKMNLMNFLVLNNEHRILSFTFLHNFDYSTMNLTEYIVNSLTLVFMVYQAINL